MRDSCVDTVVTEPPYHRDLASQVYDVLPELARVVRPAGLLALLIAGEMEPPITRAALLAGLIPVARYAIRRQKMQAVLLIHRKPD